MRKSLRSLLLVSWVSVASCSDEGASTSGTGSTGQPAAPPGWCDVEPILEAKCQRCHSDPPINAAPFPLLSYDDTQGQSGSQRVEALHAAISTGFMPPTNFQLEPPVEPLSCEEKRTLLAWLDEGAPAPGAESCAEPRQALLRCD
jgi:uncharacterized membrane protein